MTSGELAGTREGARRGMVTPAVLMTECRRLAFLGRQLSSPELREGRGRPEEPLEGTAARPDRLAQESGHGDGLTRDESRLSFPPPFGRVGVPPLSDGWVLRPTDHLDGKPCG